MLVLQNGLLANAVFPFDGAPILILLGCLVAAYLLGSINSAVLVSRLFYGEDIRKKGSGNAGLTNTARVYGKKAAALVLVGDILKTALAILITALLFGFYYYRAFAINPFLYLTAVACILGHSYPVYFKFKGGKGVLCAAAAVLILCPIVFAVELLIFAIMLFGFKYVSLSSLAVAFFYPLLTDRLFRLFLGASPDMLIMLCTVFVGLFIFYTHRTNIKRLLDHCENKISFKKKEKKDADDGKS